MGKKNSKQKEITFPHTNLVPCFTLGKEGVQTIEDKEIFLEEFSIDERQVKGKIALRNSTSFDENLEVKVRFTLNSWESYDDTFCKHIKEENEHNIGIVRFGFELDVPKNASLEFAICCRNTADGSELWDNYNEKNYKVADLISS